LPISKRSQVFAIPPADGLGETSHTLQTFLHILQPYLLRFTLPIVGCSDAMNHSSGRMAASLSPVVEPALFAAATAAKRFSENAKVALEDASQSEVACAMSATSTAIAVTTAVSALMFRHPNTTPTDAVFGGSATMP
jgi:hypothetical protein